MTTEINEMKEISGSEVHVNIYKFLDYVSNNVGEMITEYTWREVCELMKNMEDENLISVKLKV
jgi:hypothetical protein